MRGISTKMLLRHLRAALDLAKKKAPREERKRSIPNWRCYVGINSEFSPTPAKFRQRTASLNNMTHMPRRWSSHEDPTTSTAPGA